MGNISLYVSLFALVFKKTENRINIFKRFDKNFFWMEYRFRTEYGSVRQVNHIEFNSVRMEYGNHVVFFP